MPSSDNIVRDYLRTGIIEKSIQILKSHGKSDNEIKEMMLKDFSIDKVSIEKVLKSTEKD